MSNEQQNMYITRIQQKHDTEENWTKYDFTPMAGEIVVYDKDTTNTEVRFKIGDGNTPLKDLLFAGISKINDKSVEGNNSITLTGSDIEVSESDSSKVSKAINELQTKVNTHSTDLGSLKSKAIYTVNDKSINDGTNSITLMSSDIKVDAVNTIEDKLNSLQGQISSIQGDGEGAAVLKINGKEPTNGEVTLTAEDIFRKDNNPNKNSVAKEITDLTQTVTDLNNAKANKADTLAGYAIQDAYTKTETNAELNKKLNKNGFNVNGQPVADNNSITLTGSNIDVSGTDKTKIANKIESLETNKANKTETFMRESDVIDVTNFNKLEINTSDPGNSLITENNAGIVLSEGIYQVSLSLLNLQVYDDLGMLLKVESKDGVNIYGYVIIPSLEVIKEYSLDITATDTEKKQYIAHLKLTIGASPTADGYPSHIRLQLRIDETSDIGAKYVAINDLSVKKIMSFQKE